MKLAFSTVCCPSWGFETICARAKEYGYDGVEIRGFLNESFLTASNVFLTDPKKLSAMFKYHGVEICCLASSIAMTGNRKLDAKKSDEVRVFIDAAAEVDCSLVKIFDTQVRAGQSPAAASAAFGDWLVPLGDYAASRGVMIAIENLLSFRSSKDIWTILDRISHPAVGCCWDIFNGAQIGESPYVSVPILNSKIAYTHVKDAKLNSPGASYCKLGEGDVPVEKFLSRLRGIGYGGWVTFEWEKTELPNLAPPEEALPDAIAKLRKWTRDAEPTRKAAKKAAGEAAATVS